MLSKLKKAIALFINKLFSFNFGITSEPGLQPMTLQKVANPFRTGVLRNSSCMCGSGKKMKKCCGMDDYISVERFAQLNNRAKEVAEILKAGRQ
tara:strand:+ start:19884 stop:20165 length:282 start_codon:yes stop_codon:yes gene_type:complete